MAKHTSIVVVRREEKLTVCDSVRKRCWIIELGEKPVVRELSREESEKIMRESEEMLKESLRRIEESFKKLLEYVLKI